MRRLQSVSMTPCSQMYQRLGAFRSRAANGVDQISDVVLVLRKHPALLSHRGARQTAEQMTQRPGGGDDPQIGGSNGVEGGYKR